MDMQERIARIKERVVVDRYPICIEKEATAIAMASFSLFAFIYSSILA